VEAIFDILNLDGVKEVKKVLVAEKARRLCIYIDIFKSRRLRFSHD
jgi:hypothetical protein